ncbi:large ribosomal subunit protein bL12m-like [Ylistrum balloti]|uniref:large ribosomal subunit protein bL12m-like n=1 Tax=Ylistrum balloti TaxID=509963 RepID=UPI002905B1FD|nr:large ribosomal subunit protein bL12m-like [Ylistrum balloti]
MLVKMSAVSRILSLSARLSKQIHRLQHKERVIRACTSCIQRSQCTLASPHEGKSYSPKIQNIVDDIGQLTLLEVAELNELLKTTLKIKDAPVMSMAGAASAAPVAKEEEEGVKSSREQTSFDVKLKGFDSAKKIALIKEIKSACGLNLVQSKSFVESTPQVVKSGISKDEAEKLKATLEAVGASVEVM